MSVWHPLTATLERQIRAFSKELRLAFDGAVEPLHHCRVATRRLREILPLCAADMAHGPASRARRRLQRVGRALGSVREVDVALDLVAEPGQAQRLGQTAAVRLREHLLDEREERRERMLDRLGGMNTRKLERDLAEVARALAMRRQSDGWVRLLAFRTDRRARGVRAAVAAAGGLYIPDRVHAVRIAAKKLRYALEFVDDTGEARTKPTVRQLKDIQGTLGRLHDLEVLASLVQDVTFSTGCREPWQLDLEHFRLTLDHECRELHSQYVARREELLSVCQKARRVASGIWVDRGGGLATGRPLKMTLPAAEDEHGAMSRR